mmetsp:Transcript_14990/g.28122  ORF Transcript_14990/g.28122 Transcript_14990/m.28122 type:complete len:117 (-) Transcript_14990:327-677(-)
MKKPLVLHKSSVVAMLPFKEVQKFGKIPGCRQKQTNKHNTTDGPSSRRKPTARGNLLCSHVMPSNNTRNNNFVCVQVEVPSLLECERPKIHYTSTRVENYTLHTSMYSTINWFRRK